MDILKKLLLGLLILVSVSFIFTTPGIKFIQTFSDDYTKYLDEKSYISSPEFIIKYPPGVFLISTTILSMFPLNTNLSYIDQQPSWIFYKLVIFGFYILTFLSLVRLKKTFSPKTSLNVIDASIVFFLSFPITLLAIALGFKEIFAAPFFLLAISFFKNRPKIAILLFLIAVLFEWSLLILFPIFLFFSHNKKMKSNFSYLSYGFIFFMIIGSIFALNYHDFLLINKSQLINFAWNINFLQNVILNSTTNEKSLPLVFFLLIVTPPLVWYFIKKYLDLFITKPIFQNKLNLLFKIILSFLILVVLFVLNKSLIIGLSILFSLIYLKVFAVLKNRSFSNEKFILASLTVYAAFLVFFTGVSPGNLIWLNLLSILLYFQKPSKFTSLYLISINLISFFSVFLIYGIASKAPVNSEFFVFLTPFFSLLLLIFLLKTVYIFLGILKGENHPLINSTVTIDQIKLFLIVYLLLINIILIPAEGSPDTVSWSQYANATVEHFNPFFAQTVVDQRYPPLATAITGIFANLWRYLIGEDKTYAIATKLSIILFYFLTVLVVFKISKTKLKEKIFTNKDRLLAILLTFTLVIQTQGLADINIYLIPSLFIAMYLLFERKYLLCGLFMGITLSIKWQPVILIPLFLVTLFDYHQSFKSSIKKLLLFGVGLIPIPVFTWYLVIIQPGGMDAFNRAFEYLRYGAPMLSGQALNLNWIVTYILHITDPVTNYSLQHLENLNRQIPTDVAPKIFQGYLFILAVFLIVLRYWLLKKKDLVYFLNAAIMIFFSHHILNKSAYEKHLFYTVILTLFLYLIKPLPGTLKLLILFDVMAVMNLIFFYGFTGPKDVNRLFFGFDITVLFSAYYVFIFLWVMWEYLKNKGAIILSKKN